MMQRQMHAPLTTNAVREVCCRAMSSNVRPVRCFGCMSAAAAAFPSLQPSCCCCCCDASVDDLGMRPVKSVGALRQQTFRVLGFRERQATALQSSTAVASAASPRHGALVLHCLVLAK